MEENNKIPIYTDNDGLTKIDVKLEEGAHFKKWHI